MKTSSAKRKRRKAIFCYFLLPLLATLGLTICVVSLLDSRPPWETPKKDNLFPGQGGAEAGHLPNMTEKDIMEQLQKEADSSLFSFKINSQPAFKDGNSEGTLHIENPNHNTYPFVVEIFLNETGEKVYDSGGILPNHHIARAALTKTLPKGSHSATAYINVYDPETMEYLGKTAAELTLTVKN